MSFRPYPRYKPSGIDWLRGIPEHWRAEPLKRSFRVINGGTPASDNDAYWDGEVPWVTPDDLGKLSNQHILGGARANYVEVLQKFGAQLVPSSSIVLSTRAPIGHVAIAGTELSHKPGMPMLGLAQDGILWLFLLHSNRFKTCTAVCGKRDNIS